VCKMVVCAPVQVVQGDLLIGVHILSKEVDVITLKVVLLLVCPMSTDLCYCYALSYTSL